MLEGFKTVPITIGLPSVSVTKNGITFNKSAIMKLNMPEFVQLLINEEDRKIAIKPCESTDENAAKFVKTPKSISVRWNFRDLINTISKVMGWNTNTSGHRIEGEYFSHENAIVFDLTKAKTIDYK